MASLRSINLVLVGKAITQRVIRNLISSNVYSSFSIPKCNYDWLKSKNHEYIYT